MMVIVIMMWVMKIVMIKVMMLRNHFYYAPTDLEAIGEKPIVEKSVGYHKLDCHDHLCFIKCLISLFR